MFKFILFCGFALSLVLTSSGNGDIGEGQWKVINIQVCDNDEKYEHHFEINRHKMNRTHDAFTAKMDLKQTIDEGFGFRMDVCKHVDGGCKLYQVLSDDSFVNFCKKYAESNVKAALTIAGVDPPDFPIEPGTYELKDYMFDYCELPVDGIYGVFEATMYLLKNKEEVGCVKYTVEFKQVDVMCGEEGGEED